MKDQFQHTMELVDSITPEEEHSIAGILLVATLFDPPNEIEQVKVLCVRIVAGLLCEKARRKELEDEKADLHGD